MENKDTLARGYHENLPTVVRDLLSLHGVAQIVTTNAQIGFDGKRIVVPISNLDGVVAFEYWTVTEDGDFELCQESVDADPLLYGMKLLRKPCFEIIVTQGILECLVARSQGLYAICSSGLGTVMRRPWVLRMAGKAKRIAVCFKDGFEHEAKDVARRIEGAHLVMLPDDVPSFSAFFVDAGQSAGDFRRLSLAAYEAEPEKPWREAA